MSFPPGRAEDTPDYYAKYYMLNAAVPMEAYDRDASAATMVAHDIPPL